MCYYVYVMVCARTTGVAGISVLLDSALERISLANGRSKDCPEDLYIG